MPVVQEATFLIRAAIAAQSRPYYRISHTGPCSVVGQAERLRKRGAVAIRSCRHPTPGCSPWGVDNSAPVEQYRSP